MDGDEIRRMQSGVRDWTLRTVRGAGRQLRARSPHALLALLAAGAFAPVVTAAASATAVAGALAAVGVAASVGGNVLSDVLMRAVDRLRVRDGALPMSPVDFEQGLAGHLEQALSAGDQRADDLRTGIAEVLRRIDAAGAATRAAAEVGDLALQVQLTDIFTTLVKSYTSFGFLLADIQRATVAIRETLLRLTAARVADQETWRHLSTQARLMLEKVDLIERRTRAADDTGTASAPGHWWPDACPYLGLHVFEERHAAVFFGRESLTVDLVDAVAQRMTSPGMLVVSGASGSGKSSLLRAGLVPALTRGTQLAGSQDWPCVVFTPTRSPLDGLAAALTRGPMDVVAVRKSLIEDPEAAYLTAWQAIQVAGGAKATGPRRMVLVVDQFEEVFTLADADAAERDAFVTALCSLAGTRCGPDNQPPAVVVVSVRGDFLDRCARYPQLASALAAGPFMVGPMSEAELRRAITGPAEYAHLELGPGLVGTLLSDVRVAGRDLPFEVGALPLLSQAMMLIWEGLQGNRLTLRAYERMGGVANAVRVSAKDAFDGLEPRYRNHAAQVFRRLAVVTRDGQLARRPTIREDLYLGYGPAGRAEVDAVLEAFAAKRLILLTDTAVEIAHDVLLHAWPELHGWLEEDRAHRVVYNKVVEDAAEWGEHDRDSSFLYRGTELSAAQAAATRWAGDTASYPVLSEVTREFLSASRRAADRGARLRLGAVAGLVVLLLLALTEAGSAISSANRAADTARAADRERQLAVSRQVALESEALNVLTDPIKSDLTLLLAAAAYRIAPTAEARFSLLIATMKVQRERALVLRRGNGEPLSWVTAVAFSLDDRLAAVAGSNGIVELFDVATGQPVGAPLSGHNGAVNAVAFHPRDGNVLATAGTDGTVRLWNLATRQQVGEPLRGHQGPVNAVAFRPGDGGVLATAGADGTVRLWDLATRQQIGDPIVSQNGHVYDVAFSRDARTLAATWGNGAYGDAELWDAPNRHQIGTSINGHAGVPTNVAFSPDGRLLVTTGTDHVARLWSVPDLQPVGIPLTGHTKVLYAVAFNADGSMLATAGDDVRLWDVATQRPLGIPLDSGIPPASGDVEEYFNVAVSHNGKIVMAGTAFPNAQVWSLSLPDDLVAAACTQASRHALTPWEWGTTFQGQIPLTCVPDFMTGHRQRQSDGAVRGR